MRRIVAALVLAVGLTMSGCDTRIMSADEATVRVSEIVKAQPKQLEELGLLQAKSQQFTQLIFMMAFAGMLDQNDIADLAAVDTFDYYLAVATKALYENDERAYLRAVLLLKDLHAQIEAKLKHLIQRHEAQAEKRRQTI